MLKCLGAFGFGPTLIRWLETFYRDINGCVLNNGICISYFEFQRRVRQGRNYSSRYSKQRRHSRPNDSAGRI